MRVQAKMNVGCFGHGRFGQDVLAVDSLASCKCKVGRFGQILFLIFWTLIEVL